MKRFLHLTGLILLVAFAASLPAAQDKKDLDKDKKDAKKDVDKKDAKKDLDKEKDTKKDLDKEKETKSTEKLVEVGSYTGTLTQVHSDKGMTVKVMVPDPNNPNALRHQLSMAQRQNDIMRETNPIQRQQKIAQLARDMAQNQRNLYKHVDLHLQSAENIKVRAVQPPPAFDEKGNPRKYTAKELQELKGEAKLPGYISEWDQLKTGQTVYITVAGKKPTKAPVAPVKPKEKDLDGEGAKRNSDDKPYVTMIVIVADAPPK